MSSKPKVYRECSSHEAEAQHECRFTRVVTRTKLSPAPPKTMLGRRRFAFGANPPLTQHVETN